MNRVIYASEILNLPMIVLPVKAGIQADAGSKPAPDVDPGSGMTRWYFGCQSNTTGERTTWRLNGSSEKKV
jgi:hypothetical protein